MKVVLLFAVAAGVASCASSDAPQPPLRLAAVELDGHPFLVEVADTETERRLGLAHRPHLGPDRGMLFRYPAPTRPRFQVRDMRLALDLVWIRDGRVREITPSAPPRGTEVYRPIEPIDCVLEVPAGTARRLGVEVGAPFRLRDASSSPDR